jgi:hypothetical protein
MESPRGSKRILSPVVDVEVDDGAEVVPVDVEDDVAVDVVVVDGGAVPGRHWEMSADRGCGRAKSRTCE